MGLGWPIELARDGSAYREPIPLASLGPVQDRGSEQVLDRPYVAWGPCSPISVCWEVDCVNQQDGSSDSQYT